MAATKRFTYGELTLEVRAPNLDVLDAHVVPDYAGRWSFQGGKIVVDLKIRGVEERAGSMLPYEVRQGSTVLFKASGPSDKRTYRGGRPASGDESVVYLF